MTDESKPVIGSLNTDQPTAPERPDIAGTTAAGGDSSSDEEEQKVGYKRPPKHSQFKPGQSGNPKGRRRKNPRVEIPSQMGKDFRNVGRMKVRIKTPQGFKTVTAAEAVIWSIYKDAIAGKVSQQRLVLQYLFAAFEQNLFRRPVLSNADRLNLETGELDGDFLSTHWLLGLSQFSTKT